MSAKYHRAGAERMRGVPGGRPPGQHGNAALPGLSCATASAILAREKANYAPQACLQAYVLPHAGHSINLHPTQPTGSPRPATG